MKAAICCIAVLLLACLSSARAVEKREQTYIVGADIDAQGAVAQTQPEAGVTKPIAAVLDLALKRWQFVPAQRDGRAVTTHTFIITKLEVMADATGKNTLKVSFISQGPKWQHLGIPHYPADAIRAGVEGSVEVVGELQADGKLVISDSHTLVAGRTGKVLVQAFTDFVLHDRYTPETVDGKPLPARLRARVTFNLSNHSGALPKHCTISVGRVPICDDSGDGALADTPDAAGLDFLTQTGFDVGTGPQRVWRPGISSVLQPRMVNPIAIHL